MGVTYKSILSTPPETREQTWTEKDLMLYALAAGFADDLRYADELNFVWEKKLRTLPTFAALATRCRGLILRTGVDFENVVHLEQVTRVARPLPQAARSLVRSHVASVVDKGAKGAVVAIESVLSDSVTGEHLATTAHTVLARGDPDVGGPSVSPPAETHPRRAPDHSLELATHPNQALLYRLAGDMNPIHVDPEAARAAGFERPILHGLCAYAIALRAVLKTVGADRAEAVRMHRLRFTAPIYPGDTLSFDLWREANTLRFEARTKHNGVLVLGSGKTELEAN